MEKTLLDRFNEALSFLLTEKFASTKKEIARVLGISPSYLTEILKGRMKISGELIKKFLNKYPINSGFLFGLTDQILSYPLPPDRKALNQNEANEAFIPIIKQNFPEPPKVKSQNAIKPEVMNPPDNKGEDNVALVAVTARTNYLTGYRNTEFIDELPTYHIPKLYGGIFRGFEVEGHSMMPTLEHGSVVFGEWVHSVEEIENDQVYVLVTMNDGILIKRLLNEIHKQGFLICKSDAITNKNQYPNIKLLPKDVLELWRAKMKLGADFTNPVNIWDKLNDIEAEIEALKIKKRG